MYTGTWIFFISELFVRALERNIFDMRNYKFDFMNAERSFVSYGVCGILQRRNAPINCKFARKCIRSRPTFNARVELSSTIVCVAFTM